MRVLALHTPLMHTSLNSMDWWVVLSSVLPSPLQIHGDGDMSEIARQLLHDAVFVRLLLGDFWYVLRTGLQGEILASCFAEQETHGVIAEWNGQEKAVGFLPLLYAFCSLWLSLNRTLDVTVEDCSL